jgi:hypothetical protein
VKTGIQAVCNYLKFLDSRFCATAKAEATRGRGNDEKTTDSLFCWCINYIMVFFVKVVRIKEKFH